MRRSKPDTVLRNLDSDDEYRWLVLDSPFAEEFFCREFLDLELEPWQVFSVKLLRGRFHSNDEILSFISDYEMDWMFDNGYIRNAGNAGVSPYYWTTPNVLILWPYAFGKTTVVSTRVIPIMSVCDNPNARLQYIGKNETEAFTFSTSIRRELTTNKKLIDTFGAFQPQDKAVPWANQAFSVNQRQWYDVRENFEFYGTNSHAALGKRSDQVYIDDIETPDTARTPDMRAKLLEWLRIGPFTSPSPLWGRNPQGQVEVPGSVSWSRTARYWGKGVVGTIFHPQALYSTLSLDPTFTVVKFDCYRDKACTVSLSPQRVPIEKLEEMKLSLGILAFNKRARNIAYNEEEMAFREVWVRGGEEEVNGQRLQHPGCLDSEHSFGKVRDGWKVYLGFDPASGSTSRWSAYAAYVVLGMDPEDTQRRIYLVDYLKIQDNFDRMLDHLLDGNPAYGIEGFTKQYSPERVTVEKNAFGKWMIDNDRIQPYIRAGQIVSHDTGNNKSDPESGVFAMGEMVENGRFRIPYGDPSDKAKAEKFIGDLLLYPKGTNDLVMAFWLAQRPIQHLKNEYKSWFSKGGRGHFVHVPT